MRFSILYSSLISLIKTGPQARNKCLSCINTAIWGYSVNIMLSLTHWEDFRSYNVAMKLIKTEDWDAIVAMFLLGFLVLSGLIKKSAHHMLQRPV